MNRRQQLEQKGILLLKNANEKKEIAFELKFLSSLSLNQRFSLMLKKTQELRNNLEKNGHRTTPEVIKRQ
jgi:hypothetical protein